MKSNKQKLIKLHNNPIYKKQVKIFWILFASFWGFLFLLFTLISTGNLGFMPNFEELENPKTFLASQVVSEDGEVLGKYFIENRTIVRYEDISPAVIQALIATEDARFEDHCGIDMQSLGRVIIKSLLLQKSSAGGGSTITQQLAKLLFPRTEFSNPIEIVARKFKEWVIAVKLERSYTKREIITMYLNQVDFLNLAVGIKSASKIYFNVSPKELNTEQAAMLVGMVKNPAIYNPLRKPELVLARRNTVLVQMVKYKYLQTDKLDSLKKLPLELKFSSDAHKEGSATYFREFLRQYISAEKPERSHYPDFMIEIYNEHLYRWINDPLYGWCSKNLKKNGERYDIYKDGLIFHTTLNSKMQTYAEDAVRIHLSKNIQPLLDKELAIKKYPPFSNDLTNEEVRSIIVNSIKRTDYYQTLKNEGLSFSEIYKKFSIPEKCKVFTWKGTKDTTLSPIKQLLYHKRFLRSSFIAIDPSKGAVRAYVGGTDLGFFNYDMVTLGKRQVGSTIKPFLYTIAIQNGMSPCHQIPNVMVSFPNADGTLWTPRNSSPFENTGKNESLSWGLRHSVNTVSAWIMKRFKPQMVADLMHQMGVRSNIEVFPSIFLGTSELTLEELVSAYGTFANNGISTTPYYVTKITDKYGNILAEFHSKEKEVLNEHVNFTMVKMLEDVIRRGTGARLSSAYYEYGGIVAKMGGKTGTTQNHSDGFFIGFVPKLVAGAWTGGEERSIHFNNNKLGQGSNLALPIYGYFMKKVLSDPSLQIYDTDDFAVPPGFNFDVFNCDKQDVKINTNVDFDEDVDIEVQSENINHDAETEKDKKNIKEEDLF